MKILSIGNSFSTDAHKWLTAVAADVGVELTPYNLYIGRCPLDKHWNNYLSGAVDYDLQLCGESLRPAALPEVLAMEHWDVITLQQGSALSGLWDSYQPYLSDLHRVVKEQHPQARLFLHQTWSYEIDSPHEAFANYGRNQQQMDAAIANAYEKASAAISTPIIPVGAVIAQLRCTVPELDYAAGGLSLHRDGHHLSWLYGRYAAALVWCAVLTGCDIRAVRFVPEWEGQRADPELLQKINDAVWRAMQVLSAE